MSLVTSSADMIMKKGKPDICQVLKHPPCFVLLGGVLYRKKEKSILFFPKKIFYEFILDV